MVYFPLSLNNYRIIILAVLLKNTKRVWSQRSTCLFGEDFLKCKGDLPSLDYPINITVLELYEIEWIEIDFSDLIAKFPKATNITVNGRNVSRILPASTNNNIKNIMLINLGFMEISPQFFQNFLLLDTLNLQHNHLPYLPKNMMLPASLEKIYLLDNHWNCSVDLDWALQLNPIIAVDLKDLTCYGEPYPGKSLIAVAKFIKDVKHDCPTPCSCSLPKVVINPGTNVLEPIIEVNCSRKGFTTLPAMLPAKTKILMLQDNEIEDLSPLTENPAYRSVVDLHLDNNKITSIKDLEGSLWLTNYRIFSLSGNKLSEIPTYALDNALAQNPNMPSAVRLGLGGNPWRCDCVFTPAFQDMLRKFLHQIRDISDIKCSYVEGDENSLSSIISLSRSSVCRQPPEYNVQPLDLINAILACLIILVLGKLAYDYYYYKKTGRLPWIVTKMP